MIEQLPEVVVAVVVAFCSGVSVGRWLEREQAKIDAESSAEPVDQP